MDGQAAASALQLSTFTTVQSIPRKERYDGFPVTVHVTAPTMAVHQQCLVDIVAVIDISDSMNKPVIKDAAGKTVTSRMDVVKGAMTNVIQKLGAKNRLAVVPFNREVLPNTPLTVMDQKGQKVTTDKVDSMKARYGTKFSVGLNKAVQILDNRSAGDKDRRLAFIVFLSDGDDDKFRNENIPKKYPIHTFGISKEHQADTLQAMAEVTSGSYTPIVQDLEKITEKLAQLTAMLISVLAFDMRVDLKTAHTGVSLSRIESEGDKFKSSISDDKQSGVICVPSLSSGEEREFIVYLDVPEGDADTDAMDVLSVGGAYTRSWDTKQVDLASYVVSVDRPAPLSDKDKGDCKDGGKYDRKDQGKDDGKDQGKGDLKDHAKDDGKDQGKGGGKDQGKDHGKGDLKDQAKNNSKDQGKGNDKDQGKGDDKDQAKDDRKDQVKGDDKDQGKGDDKDQTKDDCKDQVKGDGKDQGKGDDKDQAKDDCKDQDKDDRKDQGKGDDKDAKDDRKDQGKDDHKDQSKGDRKYQSKGDCKDQDKGDDKDQGKGNLKDHAKDDDKDQGNGDNKDQGKGDDKDQAKNDRKDQVKGDGKDQVKGDDKDQAKDDYKDQDKDDRKDQGKGDGKDAKNDCKDQGKDDRKDQSKGDRKDQSKGDCKELEWIEKRVQYWCKVKLDLTKMYDEAKGSAAATGNNTGNNTDCKCQCQVAAALSKASLGSIERAMHHDICTAAVYAMQLRKCRTSGAKKNIPASA